jgi:hypothetical protein
MGSVGSIIVGDIERGFGVVLVLVFGELFASFGGLLAHLGWGRTGYGGVWPGSGETGGNCGEEGRRQLYGYNSGVE